MKKMINRCRIEGVLYSHTLEERTVTREDSPNKGKPYIRGKVDIATDKNKTNIISLDYTYVTETTKSGSPNKNYAVLKKIISGEYGCYTDPNVLDNATKVSVSTSLGVNDFVSNRSGAEEMICAKRIEGGFITPVTSLNADENQRNTFTFDTVIVGVKEKEAVEDDNGNIISPAKAVLDCRIFDFRNAMLPVELSAINPKAIDYFVGLEASSKNPIFTQVKGKIISEQLQREIHEKSAFGEDSVRVVSSSHKDWVVTWAREEEYEFGDESMITFDDLKKLAQDRENHLATVKASHASYQAQATSASTSAAFAASSNDGFDF